MVGPGLYKTRTLAKAVPPWFPPWVLALTPLSDGLWPARIQHINPSLHKQLCQSDSPQQWDGTRMQFLSSPILFDKTIRLSRSKFNGFVSLTVPSLYWLVSLFRRQLFPHFISFHLAFIVLLHILSYIYLKHWYLQRSPGVYKGLYHWLSLSFETVQSGFSLSARLASNSLSLLSSG